MGVDSCPGKLRGEHVTVVPLPKPACSISSSFLYYPRQHPFFVCVSVTETREPISPWVEAGVPVKAHQQESGASEAAQKGWDCRSHRGSESEGGGFVCLATVYEFTSATLV